MKAKTLLCLLVPVCLLLIAAVQRRGGTATTTGEWSYAAGDPGSMHYSMLSGISRANVNQLKLAWTWKTGEEPIAANSVQPGSFEVTPLMINDTLYLSTPYNRVIALDANSGEKIWDYDP